MAEKRKLVGLEAAPVPKTKRKSISPKLRFEVFKRDNFTCQYCGATAPSVVLEVDHIVPVAEGGETELINLATACRDCNRGKGKRKLSNTQEVDKQRVQLEELNARREQLEMMVEWKRELLDIKASESETISSLIKSITGTGLTDSGKQHIKRLVSRFGFEEVYNSTDISFSKYYRCESDYQEQRTWQFALDKIGGICYNRKKNKLKE